MRPSRRNPSVSSAVRAAGSPQALSRPRAHARRPQLASTRGFHAPTGALAPAGRD